MPEDAPVIVQVACRMLALYGEHAEARARWRAAELAGEPRAAARWRMVENTIGMLHDDCHAPMG